MKKTLVLLALAVSSFSVLANSQFKEMEKKANQGNYQAQRNLAYGYSSSPYDGQALNPILGCAWYTVILNSGSEEIHQGDIGNVRVYCGKLSQIEQQAALQQSRVIFKKVYKKEPNF